MKNVFKNAFTIAETIIVLIIIAVLLLLTLNSMRPSTKPFKMAYAKVYYALENATFGYLSSSDDIVEFPQTGADFCKALISIINVNDLDAANSRCENPNNILKAENPASLTNISGNENYYKTKLHLSDLGKYPKKGEEQYYSIITMNGITMWIEGDSKGEPFVLTQEVDAATNRKRDIQYYVVYADLNGTMGPNSPAWSEGRMADIVAFIVTEDATVVPLGHPEVDTRYLDVYVVQSSEDEKGQLVISKPMSYYEAKKSIWQDTNDSSKNIVDEARMQTYDFYQGGANIPTSSLFYMNAINNSSDENCTQAANCYQAYYPNVEKNTECDDVQCDLKIYDYF